MGACGEWAFRKKGSQELIRWFCGSATCYRPECRVKFWSARVRLIQALIEEYSLVRFFTLTLDREMIPEGEDPWDYIHLPWSRFRKRMKRRFNDFKFVAILEAHKNKKYPHIHGFTNVWMDQRTWSSIWSGCLGGVVVWVEQVKTEALGEYVSKSLEVAKYVGKEQLVEGYKQRGNHRTLWRSEKLKAKFELTKGEEWCILKKPMFDSEGELTDYAAQRGVWSYGKEERQRQDLEGARSPSLEEGAETSLGFMETEEPEDE